MSNVDNNSNVNSPLIKIWLDRVNAAISAMTGVDVEFKTSLQGRSEDNAVYHNHESQKVAAFLAAKIDPEDHEDQMDEESLPYFKIRFADGIEILADDSELYSFDPKFRDLINAVSGAFACARIIGYVGPWDLDREGTAEEKARFLAEFHVIDFGMPMENWAIYPHAPEKFRSAAIEAKKSGQSI